MQVYAGLPILTNQPTPQRGARARTTSSAGRRPAGRVLGRRVRAARARRASTACSQAAGAVVVEGGSGLYLRAALGGLAFGGAARRAPRARSRQRWARDPEALVASCAARATRRRARVDTATRAASCAPSRRSTLAAAADGRRRDAALARRRALRAPARRARPDDDRAALKERIDARVDEMLAARRARRGRRARAAGPLSRTAAQAIGVRELCAVLDGELTLDEAAARMKARTRALARRQLTWMRKLPAAAQCRAVGPRPPGTRVRRRRSCRRSSQRPPMVGCPFRRGAQPRACPLTGGRDRAAASVAGSRQGPVLQVAGPRQQLHRPARGAAPVRAHARARATALRPQPRHRLRRHPADRPSRPAKTASALRIFNPDGSEAEMCGNGVRMVARKLKMEGLLRATPSCSRRRPARSSPSSARATR